MVLRNQFIEHLNELGIPFELIDGFTVGLSDNDFNLLRLVGKFDFGGLFSDRDLCFVLKINNI
jgi:hypothetical protein